MLMGDHVMEKSLSNYNPNAKVLDDKEIKSIKKYKEKLSYLTVQNSCCSDSTLKNCDIVGSKFYNCSFNNVSLNNADIISLQVSKCKFTDVNFDGTCIEDIDFRNCIFENCSFKNFTMKNCCFTKCKFYKFKPYCCLCELNNYVKCTFIDSAFSSSFHYQIFSDCKFFNTTTEIELLGYNYGLLSNDQIALSKDTSPKCLASINNIKCLYGKYLEQNLYTNAFILKINSEYDNNQSVLLLWAEFLEVILKNNVIIKSNELLFIKNIISFFSSQNRIAPLLLFMLNNRLINIINKFPINNSKTRDDIILLINTIYFEFKKCTQAFAIELESFSSENRRLLIEIKYIEKPEKDLSQILNQFGVGHCHQDKTANGSFYEWISCPENIVTCLEIFFMLLGIAVPIVYDSIKTKKKNKSKRQVNALDLSENTPANMTINIMINNGCQILNNCSFIENNFYGYNDKNVQKVKITVEK